jgi:subtilisin family serine protease
MKIRILYLFMVLLLVSCGSGKTSGLSSGAEKVSSSPKVSVQSILSNMEKGEYKDGELLVKFKTGVVSSSSLRTNQTVGAQTIKRYSVVPNLERVKLPEGISVQDAITEYMADPNVEYAEPNYIRCASVTPNDPFFTNHEQWALFNTGQYADGTPGADIKAPFAWDITTGSGDVKVAVIDSGVDFNHPDLVNNIWMNPGETCTDGIDHDGDGFVNDCRGWNFVDNNNDPSDDIGHGTHVSGIIGAVGNNALGMTGEMWHVKIMPLKIFDANSVLTGNCASALASDEIDAIQYAIDHGAKVINASFGSEGFCQSELNAISAANNAGVLFVAAAGNMGINNDVDPQYPASYNLPNIISVAATDQNDRLATFSDFGPTSIHVAAPGVYILSTVPFAGVTETFSSLCTGSFDVGYDFCSGTSMSAPHVTGLAGLLFNYYNGVQNTQFSLSKVRDTILRYVDTVDNDPGSPNLESLKNKIQTSGRVNAYKAVSSLLPPTNLVATQSGMGKVSLTWQGNATGEDGYRIEAKDDQGGSFAEFYHIPAIARPAASPQPPVTYTFDKDGFTTGATYTFRVRAFNNIANSFYSNESAVTFSDWTPPPPSGGGGCSIGVRQNTPTSFADAAILLMPLLLIAVLRRKR